MKGQWTRICIYVLGAEAADEEEITMSMFFIFPFGIHV